MGHVGQRKDGSWGVVVELGHDLAGRRVRRTFTCHGTEEDALRDLAQREAELHTAPGDEPTLAAFMESWLTDHAQHRVGRTTLVRYRQLLENNVLPHLGHLRLSAVSPQVIQAHYATLLTTGRRNGHGGLSAQTVAHAHRLLHVSMKTAVRWGLLDYNPVDRVDPPRVPHREMHAPDEEETARLLSAAKGSPLYPVILTAVTTGLRRGELMGLQWKDVDFDTGQLMVRRSLEETKDGLRFKQPKTSRSRRLVALPSVTVECLVDLREQQEARKGEDCEDNDAVFCEPDGKLMKPGYLTWAFRKLADGVGLKDVRLHDLRHGHASQLLQQGVHPKVVAERLGHSTITLTMNTYSHVVPAMQEDAALRTDTLIRGAISRAE